MTLVDTSVWVGHLRTGDDTLAALLDGGRVLVHPFVIGELALGTLRNRAVVLGTMHDLPHCAVATDREVLHFIQEQALSGLGIGYVDVHLLAAVRLTAGTALWTHDRRLRDAAARLGLAAALRTG